MARYIALAPLYIGTRYVEAGQTIADDGTGDIPIPTSYVPSPARDPQDADAIAKLTAAPHKQPPPDTCILQIWGIRTQFVTRPVPAPSAAWKSLVHP